MSARRPVAYCAAGLLLFFGGCSPLGSSQNLDVVGEIRAFNESLIAQSPSQAATKFRKMQKDLVAFNRGLNHVFYRYVRSVGLQDRWLGSESRRVILHGDFHVENLGAYQNADGRVVVDLMDFDDSFQGPALLDIYRCASSLFLAAHTDPMRERLVKAFVKSYVDTMENIAVKKMSADLVLDENSSCALVRKLIEDARNSDKATFYAGFARCKWTGGKRVFCYSSDYEQAPMAVVQELMQSYLAGRGANDATGFYRVLDAVVEKGSGVGSAGAFKVRVLVSGPTDDPNDDVLLEFKQEIATEGEPFAVGHYVDQGLRVLQGERTMQTLCPAQIGTARQGGRDFFVTELSAVYAELRWKDLVGSRAMEDAATIAGMLLAKGHARSSRDSGAVAAEIAQLLGPRREEFFQEVLGFSTRYEMFLKNGYERFSRHLTVNPLLMLMLRGFGDAR